MQLDRIFYPILTLGYGKRVGIWTVGCPHACSGCSNPELWESNPIKDLPVSDIMKYIKQIRDPIDGVTISGGEPFEQAHHLYELVDFLFAHVSKDILVYSGYTLEELRQRKCLTTDGILRKISVLIDGKYIEEQNDNLSLRGSSNQRVHVLNHEFDERYQSLLGQKRQVQTVHYGDNLVAFGIPVREYRQQMNQCLSERHIFLKHPTGRK